MKKYGIDWFDWVFELLNIIINYSIAISTINYIFELNISGEKLLLLIISIILLNVKQLRSSIIVEKVADKILLKSDKE